MKIGKIIQEITANIKMIGFNGIWNAVRKFIAETIREYVNQNLDIELNNSKSYLRHNEIGFKRIWKKTQEI